MVASQVPTSVSSPPRKNSRKSISSPRSGTGPGGASASACCSSAVAMIAYSAVTGALRSSAPCLFLSIRNDGAPRKAPDKQTSL